MPAVAADLLLSNVTSGHAAAVGYINCATAWSHLVGVHHAGSSFDSHSAVIARFGGCVVEASCDATPGYTRAESLSR